MKPSKSRCKKYCNEYPCTRTDCSRKLVLWAHKDSAMEEPRIWQPIDNQFRKRAYIESPLTKQEMITKY